MNFSELCQIAELQQLAYPCTLIQPLSESFHLHKTITDYRSQVGSHLVAMCWDFLISLTELLPVGLVIAKRAHVQLKYPR
jgi:hypothetical protein